VNTPRLAAFLQTCYTQDAVTSQPFLLLRRFRSSLHSQYSSKDHMHTIVKL